MANNKKFDWFAVLAFVVTIILAIPPLMDSFGFPFKENGRKVAIVLGPVIAVICALYIVYRYVQTQRELKKLTVAHERQLLDDKARLEDELRRTKEGSFEELRRLEASFEGMHKICHYLRNENHEAIDRQQKEIKNFDEGKKEAEVLKEVCNEIAELFRGITNDVSLVCIREVSTTVPDEAFLAAFCSNHSVLSRGMSTRINFKRYTRYKSVYQLDYSERTLHFFCDDVGEAVRSGNYHDPDFTTSRYGSTLVIPLRCLQEPKSFLGFLKLQTTKPKKLNNNWHVELLAMLGDMIFCYINATRALSADDESPQPQEGNL